jgi:hypothetical protein
VEVRAAGEDLGSARPWETVTIGVPGALYYVERDPGEKRDLAAQLPDTLVELEALPERIRQEPDGG